MHVNAINSISKTEIEMHRVLFRDIVLTGGNTLFNAISERIQKEIESLADGKSCVRVIAPPERLYSAWIGGSVLASL